MHDNDVQMSRVYTRVLGGTILDQTFRVADGNFEVAVDGEAGSTIFGLNPPFELSIVITDLTANVVVHTDSQSGTLNSADWPTVAHTFEFTIPIAAFAQDHVHNVIACLKVGGVNPNVSFAESPMFITTA